MSKRYYVAVNGSRFGFGRNEEVALRALVRCGRPLAQPHTEIWSSTQPLQFETLSQQVQHHDGETLLRCDKLVANPRLPGEFR